MKLVQKLSIGLSVACVMMMSSCSKENALTPEPKTERVNEHSSAKTDAVPWIASTKGVSGNNAFPQFWQRLNNPNYASPSTHPAGTSTRTGLWGKISYAWWNPLSATPDNPAPSFVTVTTSSKWDAKKMAFASTKIRFLTPGKNYHLKFYVASSVPKANDSGKLPSFAKQGNVWIASSGQESQKYTVDLTSYKNCWVETTITFKAKSSEMEFIFSALAANESQFAYAHVFVGQDAVWQQ
ncbi:hypothetical protein [Dyadobacter pollutisoli]|uniref:Uncharacterized protein n=1 Tax=Dyadobacter pollutisoli TaxID=2910158 RepID=A0A9E8SJI2_9BACT|nr:hypothetical protein [Dyadobacter pollutisoli]WAC11385.1 hypothetical protein ON006_27090 [Dyadobacter pollutisoli]